MQVKNKEKKKRPLLIRGALVGVIARSALVSPLNDHIAEGCEKSFVSIKESFPFSVPEVSTDLAALQLASLGSAQAGARYTGASHPLTNH